MSDTSITKPNTKTGAIRSRRGDGGTSLFADAMRRLARNRAAVVGGVIVVLNLLAAVLAPYLAPKAYDAASFSDTNSAPYWVTRVFRGMKPVEEGGYVKVNNDYVFGADKLGRDLFSRIIYGSRVSIAVAFVGPLISLSIGLLVGLISGYLGGKVDNLMMRIVDIMYAFPTMLLILLLMSFFRASSEAQQSLPLFRALSKLDSSMGGVLFIFIGIGLTAWMGAARLVRGQVLHVREMEYVEATRALGGSPPWIIFKHILPNIIAPLIVTETLAIPSYISYEAFLSFIGLGVNPPTPSWGAMIAEGAPLIQSSPNQAIFPALALFVLMFAFNFLGDGLRDALDPTLRNVS